MRNNVLCMALITIQISIVLATQYDDQYEESTALITDSDDGGVTEVFASEAMMHEVTRLMASTQQAFIRYPASAVSVSNLRSRNNFNCDNFLSYAVNCTEVAGVMYGSSRKAPPIADKLQSWCNALIHLTNCASDWNSDCKDVADSHFDRDSLEGHIHVVDNVCLDTNFTSRYKEASSCIEDTTFEWEFCYSQFKDQIDEMKNSSLSWTHYHTHFTLCCARAVFRGCTLEFLFTKSSCTQDQAITMQRFSVIVSEGDVHQDCDKNINFANCPGGDPHPKAEQILKQKGVVQNVPPSLRGVNKQDVERNFSNRIRSSSVVIPVLWAFILLLCSSMIGSTNSLVLNPHD